MGWWDRKGRYKTPIIEPIKNEKWLLKQIPPKNRDPWWEPEVYSPVLILGVKEGWVRYDMGHVFRNQKMKMATFLHCYSKVED